MMERGEKENLELELGDREHSSQCSMIVRKNFLRQRRPKEGGESKKLRRKREERREKEMKKEMEVKGLILEVCNHNYISRIFR